jgi:hypothetical protein
MAWRAGGESINSLILQGGELQRARAAAGAHQPVRLACLVELHGARRRLRYRAPTSISTFLSTVRTLQPP